MKKIGDFLAAWIVPITCAIVFLVFCSFIAVDIALRESDPTGIRLISRTMKVEVSKSLGVQTLVKTEYIIQHRKYGMWFDVRTSATISSAEKRYKIMYDQFVERQFRTTSEKVILEYP